MRRLTVHIDRLVLHGYRHEDRHAIASGLETALRARLSEPGAAAQWAASLAASESPALTATIPVRSTAHHVGAAIAGVMAGKRGR